MLVRGELDVANLYFPNFLRQRAQDAPIVGLSTEWKSTAKGNGMFVRRDAGIGSPKDLEGRLVASHQGVHRFHPYLLRRAFGVDDTTLRWVARPQGELLGTLLSGEVDAAVLLDQFFVLGAESSELTCLYTDGDAWQKVSGFDEMIKHMIAVKQSLLDENPGIKERLLRGFRESFAYSEAHLEEVAHAFTHIYGGDREALMTSARYPRIEFTFTPRELAIATAEVTMLVETGLLDDTVDVGPLFAV